MALQLCLNWTGQAEIKILSEIFEYPSLSNMWGFLTVFQIIWDTGDCAAWGELEGVGSYLAWPGFPSRVSDEYANTNTHPFLCLVAGWLDLILIFRLPHNIYVADSLLVSDQFLTRTENCFGKARNFLWKKHQKANIGSFYWTNSSDLKQAQKCPWHVQVQISWEQWSTNVSLAAIILVFDFCPLALWKGLCCWIWINPDIIF